VQWILAFRQGLTYVCEDARRPDAYTHRNDDPPAMKLLPFAGNKICQHIDSVNVKPGMLYELLRRKLFADVIRRENDTNLAANFRLQFGRNPADIQPRVVDFVLFHQAGKSFRFIQHGIDVLRLR